MPRKKELELINLPLATMDGQRYSVSSKFSRKIIFNLELYVYQSIKNRKCKIKSFRHESLPLMFSFCGSYTVTEQQWKNENIEKEEGMGYRNSWNNQYFYEKKAPNENCAECLTNTLNAKWMGSRTMC